MMINKFLFFVIYLKRKSVCRYYKIKNKNSKVYSMTKNCYPFLITTYLCVYIRELKRFNTLPLQDLHNTWKIGLTTF